jgi:hypothetical protein
MSLFLKRLSVLLLAFTATTASAGELDNEKAITADQIAHATQLPATVVVRVNDATKEVAVLHAKTKLATDDQALTSVIASGEFQKINVNATTRGELDRESSTSSWYFWFNYANWYYPTYYYWGYSYPYTNYYWYNTNGYSYYWYRWMY